MILVSSCFIAILLAILRNIRRTPEVDASILSLCSPYYVISLIRLDRKARICVEECLDSRWKVGYFLPSDASDLIIGPHFSQGRFHLTYKNFDPRVAYAVYIYKRLLP